MCLYEFLSPNAYPQLSEHVKIIDKMAISHVYDVCVTIATTFVLFINYPLQVMPIFTWKDGSTMYLHVDVHGFHEYLTDLQNYLRDVLTPRLQWLYSGSRVPFGVMSEESVVVMLDSSHSALAEVLTLQGHLRLLLEEQIANATNFNMVR